jgi:hypothetical protein
LHVNEIEHPIHILVAAVPCIRSFPRLTTVSARRALELEGYSTDVTHLREKLRKLEHALISFKGQHNYAPNEDGPITTEFMRRQRQIDATDTRGSSGNGGGGGGGAAPSSLNSHTWHARSAARERCDNSSGMRE